MDWVKCIFTNQEHVLEYSYTKNVGLYRLIICIHSCTQTCTHTDMYPRSSGDFGLQNTPTEENPFGFGSVEKCSLVKTRVLHLIKNSLHQTTFLNALESKQIFSTTHDCILMGGKIKETGWDTFLLHS